MSKEAWEEDFDEKFIIPNSSSPTGYWWKVAVNGYGRDATPERVKTFIYGLLSLREKEIIRGSRELRL